MATKVAIVRGKRENNGWGKLFKSYKGQDTMRLEEPTLHNDIWPFPNINLFK